MEISQACFNTSLMGVVKGVADYFEIELSTAELYGRSGHAFLMNIHEAVCPSGPYCWNMDTFIALLENCGIRMNGLGFFSAESSSEERAKLEERVKVELEKGNPCAIVNMDYQLINGVDETGFLCTQPWKMDFPPAHLTFGSWKEMKDEIHACFFSFEKVNISDQHKSLVQALKFINELKVNPQKFTMSPYTAGLLAYDVWISAVEKGYGNEHGNWWNGTVWAECRKEAASYFKEMSLLFPDVSSELIELSDLYDKVAGILVKVSFKDLEKSVKINFLQNSKKHETAIFNLVGKLTASLIT